MDNPVEDVEGVIRQLTQGSPQEQEDAINTYFTPDAEFIHPFIRTWALQGSRWLILKIYQWYKIMSPKIEMTVHGVAFDEKNLTLYVNLTQIFSIWLLPFHHSEVNLDTKLTLIQHPNSSKYYIQQQNDLYAVGQWIRFVLPWFGIGPALVAIWHFWALLGSVLGAILLAPLGSLERNWSELERKGNGSNDREGRGRAEGEVRELTAGRNERGGKGDVQQFGSMQVIT